MTHHHATNQKGTRVSHAQSSAKAPSRRTVGAARLVASLRGGGSGAGFLGGRTALLKLAALTAIVAAAFWAVVASPASAATQRPFEAQIPGFTSPNGLSVDPADDLWVTDPGNAGLISELSPFPANAKIGEQDGEGHFTFGGLYIESAAFSAANEHLYVGDSGNEIVHVFKPNGEWEETWTGFSGYVHLAIDNSSTASEGRVYVSESSGTVKAFKPNGEAEPFSASAPYIEENKLTGTPTGPGEALEPFAGPWAMTVATDGDLYVIDGKSVDRFEPSGLFVRQFTAPSPLRAVAVDPTSGNLLAATETAILELSPTGALQAKITKANGASFTELQGLAVDSTGVLYAADRSAGLVDVFGPAEPLPVETDGGSVSAVTDTTATLRGQVTPNGHNASYAFLYGTADCTAEPLACTEVPSPMAPLGNGETTLEVTQALGALAPATTYHYRLLVENTDTHELLPTPDRSFTTQGPASSLLPDNRAYELVSPPNKHGAPLESIPLEGGLIQAAADGHAIAYFAKAPVTTEPEGSRSTVNSQLLSTRGSAGGWSTADIATPHQAPSASAPAAPPSTRSSPPTSPSAPSDRLAPPRSRPKPPKRPPTCACPTAPISRSSPQQMFPLASTSAAPK
jgi:sugar lactone lactonase YvrE